MIRGEDVQGAARGAGGGGGCMSISPVGYIEIGRNGSTFRPIGDPIAYVPLVSSSRAWPRFSFSGAFMKSTR